MYVYIYIYLFIYLMEEVLGCVISLSLTGNFKIFKLIAIPVALENKKFLYIDTRESMLCLD